MEYLDLYDKNGNLTGETVLRSKDMKPETGKYIKVVIVFIQNNEGKFLIQRTSKQKGSQWATTGGLVSSGYTPDETIVKEIQEELGLIVDFSELKHIYSERKEHALQDAYYLKKDIEIKNLILQPEEVEFVKWLSIDEIKELINNNEFRKGNINPFYYLIEKKKV